MVDLRSLRPLDVETVAGSVSHTNRAVLVEEGWPSYGVTAELAARIQKACFEDLDAPVERVGTAEVPLPYAKNLENAALPNQDRIAAAVLATVGSGTEDESAGARRARWAASRAGAAMTLGQLVDVSRQQSPLRDRDSGAGGLAAGRSRGGTYGALLPGSRAPVARPGMAGAPFGRRHTPQPKVRRATGRRFGQEKMQPVMTALPAPCVAFARISSFRHLREGRPLGFREFLSLPVAEATLSDSPPSDQWCSR